MKLKGPRWGSRLLAARQAKGASQRALAAKLRVKPQTLVGLERGDVGGRTQLGTLVRYCLAYGLDPHVELARYIAACRKQA